MDSAPENFDKVSYHHIKIGDGRVTVGYMPDVNRDEKVRTVIYGLSYLNYKEDKYVKKTGRE